MVTPRFALSTKRQALGGRAAALGMIEVIIKRNPTPMEFCSADGSGISAPKRPKAASQKLISRVG